MSDQFLMIPAVTCETCGGSGYGGNAGHVYNSDDEYHGMAEHQCVQCPVPCAANCVNGLVPSPEAIEAGAEANWYEWHKGHPGGFKGAMRAMARASLFAAAFTPQGDPE
jgi:hypothetical protein